jgi:hypothetical protein
MSVRKRLSKDEADIIEGIRSLCQEQNISVKDVKHGWSKSEGASLFFTNPGYKPKSVQDFEALGKTLIDDLRAYTPRFDKIERKPCPDPHLLVVDPADIHIGKLCSAMEVGEKYDSQIAVRRVLQGVKGILDKTSGVNIDKILFVGGNDLLHVDGPNNTTTSGTRQDVSGIWHENFLIAKQLYIDCLELLLSVADVHFTFNPSNHDYISGYFLAHVIEAYFRNHPNITFDVSIAHRKGFKYGQNLIGTTHGDGAKIQDLPILMAQEFPIWWSQTKHRYVYTHHVHHKMAKDYIGVTVESLRSPSGTDSWHHRNGMEHAPKAVEGFLHHPDHGQVIRITNIF